MPEFQEFSKASKPLFQFYEEGRFEDALAVAERLAPAYPAFAVKTYYWRICLLSVTGRQAEALRLFEEALANGIWWFEGQLRSDPDLKSLQGNEEFERLILLSNEKTMNAQQIARPELFTYVPDGTGPFPLLVVLHARGSSPEFDVHFWKSVVKHGWFLAMPQSSQLASPMAYLWDDREKALAEIAGHVDSLIERRPVDPDRIVIAGFSQGAARAMQIVMGAVVKARGFLAVVPGTVEDGELDGWSASAGTRDVLISGGRDPRQDFFQKVKELFEAKLIPLMFRHYPEMGHDFPDDFEDILEKGLNFILNI
jgi:predicted esterase